MALAACKQCQSTTCNHALLGRTYLGRVSGLRAVPLAHSLLRVQVVICLLLLLAKLHAASGPVCSESTRLNASELDTPLWLHLFADSLREALDGPLAGTVDAEQRNTTLSTNGCNLLDQSSRGFVVLAHDLHRSSCALQQTEEVHLHLLAGLRFGHRFKLAAEAVASVVDDDIDAVEGFEGGVEGFVYRAGRYGQ